jgi:Tat protein secretion system quality control protein TatD with DNase activity
VARCLAELREISFEEAGEVTATNFARLFGLALPN